MTLRRRALQWAFDRYYGYRYDEFVRAPAVIPLDYRVQPIARYGYGQPTHWAIARRLARSRVVYERWLDRVQTYHDDLAAIALEPNAAPGATGPYWNNPYFSLLDAAVLYTVIADTRPALYLEIGGGHSTCFAALAVRRRSPSTSIISIDPHPRLPVDPVLSDFVREPLEAVPVSYFDRLVAGDILFLDGSHRVFQNSDVSVFFLDILPRVPAGVLVHFHDVFWPLDYPPEWGRRYYSEQYLLGVALLHQGRCNGPLSPMLPNAYISYDRALRSRAERLWTGTEAQPLVTHRAERHWPLGTSFWCVWRGIEDEPGDPLSPDSRSQQ